MDDKEILSQRLEKSLLYINKIRSDLEKRNRILTDILNNINRIVFALDKEGMIILWNRTAEICTGFKKSRVIGKKLSDYTLDAKPLEAFFGKISKNKRDNKLKIVLKKSDNSAMYLLAEIRIIDGSLKNEIDYIIFLCEDITHEKELANAMHPGRGYFIKTKDKMLSPFFLYKLSQGYKGLLITRDNPIEVMSSNPSSAFDIIFLGSQNSSNAYKALNNLEELKGLVIKQIRISNSIILINRIEYLISLYGFQQFMNLVYEINESVIGSSSILVFCLSSSTNLENYHEQLLYNELIAMDIERKNMFVTKEEYTLLSLLRDKNMMGAALSFKEVASLLRVTKPTVKSRIENLERAGYLDVEKKGRVKIVNLTKRGGELFFS